MPVEYHKLICLHTTESDPGSLSGVVNYLNSRPSSLPHTAYDPSTGEEHIFLDAGQSARALRNLPGGVETNNRPGGVFQVEIVGRAAECGGYDDEWYSNLQAYLAQWATILGVEYHFRPDPTRLTADQWMDPNLSGIVGHVHVPENDHSDPGTLDLSRLRISLPNPNQKETPVGLEIGTLLTDGKSVNDHLIWTNDQANKAVAQTSEILALLKAAPAPPGNIRTCTTAELLAELVRRQSA